MFPIIIRHKQIDVYFLIIKKKRLFWRLVPVFYFRQHANLTQLRPPLTVQTNHRMNIRQQFTRSGRTEHLCRLNCFWKLPKSFFLYVFAFLLPLLKLWTTAFGRCYCSLEVELFCGVLSALLFLLFIIFKYNYINAKKYTTTPTSFVLVAAMDWEKL